MYFYVIVYLASYFAATTIYTYKNKDKLLSSGSSQISQKVSNIHRCHIYMRTYQNTKHKKHKKGQEESIGKSNIFLNISINVG